jgi:hypothetical protein
MDDVVGRDIMLGADKRMFTEGIAPTTLTLLGTEVSTTGVVVLRYERSRDQPQRNKIDNIHVASRTVDRHCRSTEPYRQGSRCRTAMGVVELERARSTDPSHICRIPRAATGIGRVRISGHH